MAFFSKGGNKALKVTEIIICLLLGMQLNHTLSLLIDLRIHMYCSLHSRGSNPNPLNNVKLWLRLGSPDTLDTPRFLLLVGPCAKGRPEAV